MSQTDVLVNVMPREETVVNHLKPKNVRPRNFSFSKKNPNTLDSIDTPTGIHPIPATPGSTYWAILRIMYSHFGQRVSVVQLLEEVNELMTERDEETWTRYCKKGEATVFHRVTGLKQKQKVNSWQDRIVGNAKTLTRLGGSSPYGQRLFELGHSLIFSHDEQHKPFFLLAPIEK